MPVPILAAVRSPFAPADGVLAGWHPIDLAMDVASVALDQAGLEPAAIDHVWVGCDEPVGAQGANAARALVLGAGWPEAIAGTVVEASPTSGMSALAAACDAVLAGRIGIGVVLGMASASVVQPGASALGRVYGRPWGDAPAARYADTGGLVPPIVAADRAAVQAGIDRAMQEAWAVGSIERRSASPGAISPVGARPGGSAAVQKGTPVVSDAIRAIAVEALEPMFDPDGTTTAATFAPAADGISVLIVAADTTSDSRSPIGEVTETRIAAGSPFDPSEAVARLRFDMATVDQATIAAGSASIALLAERGLGSEGHPDPLGGTIAVGDAAAAEDLRLVVDGLAHADIGVRGLSVRAGAGAAAGCLWRRL
ncbi:MAG: hypothetical protein AAGA37_11100 [Actinomycetota bacterium]